MRDPFKYHGFKIDVVRYDPGWFFTLDDPLAGPRHEYCAGPFNTESIAIRGAKEQIDIVLRDEVARVCDRWLVLLSRDGKRL